MLMDKTPASRKVARALCCLEKERGRAESTCLGWNHHPCFSFSEFLSPSVRTPVVFLAAEPTQETKYFVFLQLRFPESLHI